MFVCSKPELTIHKTVSESEDRNVLMEAASYAQSKSSPEMGRTDQKKQDEIWWLLANLKSALTRLQDRLISKNIISSNRTLLKTVRERVEGDQTPLRFTKKRTPMELFSTIHKSDVPILDPSPTSTVLADNGNYKEENRKDWNQVSEYCRKLEQVVQLGREMLEKSTPETNRDRLTEYSFRAGSFIAQMILSEVRSIGNVIRSIEELLVQFRAEISRNVSQSVPETPTPPDSSRGIPHSFKDLILQETDVLSALTGLTSNKVSSSSKVHTAYKNKP